MSEHVTNIVLVGRTGNGKSATGNSLLGQSMFLSQAKAAGVTMKCEMYRAAIQDGPIINVIDTPGLFDMSMPADYVSKEIIKCLTMAEGGIHAMLFVLSVKTRFTNEEESTFNSLQFIFDGKIFDYLIVVFTGGDELEYNNKTLDDYLREGCPAFLTRLLRLSGGRKVLFNNVTKDDVKKAKQINQLLAHVKAIGENNNGKPYTDKIHHLIKDEGYRVREMERKFKFKKLEAEAAVMGKNIKLEYEENIRQRAQIFKKRLLESSAALRELRNAQQIRLTQNIPLNNPFPQRIISVREGIIHVRSTIRHSQNEAPETECNIL